MLKDLRVFAVAGVLTLALAGTSWAEEADGPWENIKTTPVKATWQYSNDGGKTFSDKVLPGPPRGVDPRHRGNPV